MALARIWSHVCSVHETSVSVFKQKQRSHVNLYHTVLSFSTESLQWVESGTGALLVQLVFQLLVSPLTDICHDTFTSRQKQKNILLSDRIICLIWGKKKKFFKFSSFSRHYYHYQTKWMLNWPKDKSLKLLKCSLCKFLTI